MPRFGNIVIPDALMPGAPAPERPGYGRLLADAAKQTAAQVTVGLPLEYKVLQGTATAQDQQQAATELAAARGGASPASVDDYMAGRVGLGRLLAENAVASLPSLVGMVAGGVAGGVVGGPGGAVLGGSIAGGIPQFVGSNVDRAVQENGKLDQSAALRTLAAAPVQSALNSAEEVFLPGAGAILGPLATRFAAKEGAGLIRRVATKGLEAGAVEAVSEAAQQAGERWSAGKPLDNAEAAREYVNAAVIGFGLGGVIGGVGGIVNTHPADRKPAGEVTTDELLDKVNQITGPRAPLMLPPPPDMIGRPDGSTEVNPNGSTPLMLPPPVQPADIVVDSQGNAVPNLPGAETDLMIARNAPRPSQPNTRLDNVTPEVQAVLDAAKPPVEAPAPAPYVLADPNVRPFDPAALPSSQPVISGLPEQAPARPFAGVSDEDLKKVARSASQDPAHAPVIAQAIAELDARKAEKTAVDTSGTPAVAPLAAGRLNQDLAKLRGLPVEDQVAGIRALLENGDTRATTLAAAERAGIDTNAKGEAAPAVSLDERPGVPPLPPEAQQGAAPAPITAPEAAPITQETATKLETPSAEAAQGGGGEAAVLPTGGEVAPASPQAQSVEIPGGSQADPAFVAKWDELKSAASQKIPADHWAQTFTPANQAQAEAKVMTELGNVDAFQTGRAGEGDVTEKLAKKLGLVTNDKAMDVTPKGRSVWLGTSQGLEATIEAARSQGYDGKQAAIFERGVRDALAGGEKATQHADFGDWQAYEQGRAWAETFVAKGEVRTARQSKADVMDRIGAGSRELSPRQIEQQAQNKMLDALDLRAVQDSDIAALRRAVRDGVSGEELGRTVQQVQGGKTLFKEAPRGEPPVLSQPDGRGQPAFKEIDQRAPEPQKAQQRAETEGAVESYRQRQLIEGARSAGLITDARAEKLHSMLDAGKVEQVARNTKRYDDSSSSGAVDPTYARYQRGEIKYAEMSKEGQAQFEAAKDARILAALQEEDPSVTLEELQRRRAAGLRAMRTVFGSKGNAMQDSVRSALDARSAELERAVDGKSFAEVADHLIAEAPSRYHRVLMQGVKGLMGKLERAGAKFDFKVVHPGEGAPEAMLGENTRAYAETTRVPPHATIYIKSVDTGFSSGMSYETIAHEMIHAVTQMAFDVYSRRHAGPNDKIAHAVYNMERLLDAVKGHLAARTAEARGYGRQLTEFEQKLANGTNALADTEELLAWGLTNPDMQRYLASIEYKPKQSVWSKFVGLVREILGVGHDGIAVSHHSALAELLRVSETIMEAGQPEITSMVGRFRADGFARGILSAAYQSDVGPRTAQAANDATKAFVGQLGKIADNLNLKDKGVKARRALLYITSSNHIAREFGDRVKGLLAYRAAHGERVAVRSRFELMGDQAVQLHEQLQKSNPNAAKWVGQLMATATEFQVDPDKSWAEHTWIPEGERAQVKPLYDQAVKMKNDLKRGDGAGWKVYQEFRTLNEAQNLARLAVGLHGLVANDPELSQGIENSWANPADEFMRADGLDNATKVRDHWQSSLTNQVKAALDFVQAKKGEYATASAGDQQALRQHLSPIELRISEVMEARKAMDRAPYFHLGRFGDNFGAASIKLGEDGKVAPASQRVVAAALEKAGFDNVQISADNTKPKIYLRFENVDQTERFRAVMRELEAQGHIQKDTILAGPRSLKNNFGTADGLPAYIRSYIQSLETSAAFTPDDNMSADDRAVMETYKQKAIQQAIDTWIESQPDTSISKVLTKRYTVPGYNPDMVRNWNHRWRVGSISIANVAAQPKFNAAVTDMRAQAQEALKTGEDPYLVQDVLREMQLRDAKAPINEVADSFDKLRGYAHSFFLGFSPAYGLINIAQVGSTALPELAKVHGYAKSFHAMRRAMTPAMAVVKAVFAQARQVGWKNLGDVAVTEQVLKNAGLDASTRNFITHMMASGTIDIGSMARSMGRIEDSTGVAAKTDTILKLSSSIGLYTETFSRLLTALAARELHGGYGEGAQAYAAKTVKEALFDYRSDNTARAMGKQGILGRVTPMVTQFMTWQTQMLEKLYSEFHDAFGAARPGESAATVAERKAASRRFLAGHLAMTAALSGTLGLPFATVFANVLDRLFGSDDEPLDVTAAYRDFLAQVLGKDVAEVVARGVPRAFGFDISQRAGEQDILPGTALLADRRSWKDALANNTGRGLGAVPSMITSIMDGGSQMLDGDVLGGLKQMLPVALKNPTEVYRMTQDGYVDTKSNKLPLTPKASAYLWQLLGFAPSEKAEYQEARQDQMVRHGLLVRRAGLLRGQIVDAIQSGDRDKAQQLVADAMAFDKANPQMAVLPSVGAAITRQKADEAQAVALKAPIGVSVRDLGGQGLTRYANWGN